MPWKGLYAVPLGLLNFNFAFMKITCALDVPCRRPEWLSDGEVEKEWLHLREAYASEWPQGCLGAQMNFTTPRGRGLRLSRLQIYRNCGHLSLSSMGRTGLAIVLDPRKPLV